MSPLSSGITATIGALGTAAPPFSASTSPPPQPPSPSPPPPPPSSSSSPLQPPSSATQFAATTATSGSPFAALSSMPSVPFASPAGSTTSSPISMATSTLTMGTTTSAPASITSAVSAHKSAVASNQSPITIFSAPIKQYKPDHLATIDLIIIVIYLCLLLSTSISTMIRAKKSRKRKAALAAAANGGRKTAAAQNNFLASRKMNWFTVGASIFASNLGSEHFIGLSGSAAANGISVAAFEMNALIILQLATWIFLPVLISAKISTLPEYMSKRFGGKRIRTYLAILSILLYIFTKISVNLYSGGIFIQQAVGWNLYTSAMFILALTCVMTLTGGLKGAMMIDNLQAIVMTIGASIVSASALVQVGGLTGLRHKYSLAVPSKVPANLTHCAQPNPRAFQMLRPAGDRDMPWLGFLIGQTPASIWYWAADQMMVQRFLSARSLAHVQGSAVFAGYLKILPLFFMIIPGMISRCLFTDEVGCIDPVECQRYCQSSVSCSNTAYPRLVLELMPLGARGMMVAAMVAALMQDLCNVFNSASALFSCDIWPLCRKCPTQKEQETAGRVFVICLVFASIMWIPVIQEMQGGQLFIYIQAVAAMFWPPICAVYICAIMWRRTNETGAFWSLMIGFMLGVTRMAMSFMYKEPSCGQHVDERPWLLKEVHYMYYAAFLFWATILSVILISKLTRPPAPFRLIRTTFWTRFDTTIRRDDKNVFEMKYSGATIATSATSSANSLSARKTGQHKLDTLQATKQPNGRANQVASPNEDLLLGSTRDSQQQLLAIEEQQQQQQQSKKSPDLSAVIVDISKAAEMSAKELASVVPTGPQTAPIGGFGARQKPVLQHQASLTASATAVVGEAGKFLANKLANTEANLRGARDMVLAAANHFTGGGAPDSRIRFKNLQGDEEEDEESGTNAAESTMDDEEEEEDDDDEQELARKQRLKRNRRSHSVLSAALSSYKRAGYKQALAEDDEDDDDDDEDDDDEEDDDDDDEKMNLNRSASFNRASKSRKGANGPERSPGANQVSSSTDGAKSLDLLDSGQPLARLASGKRSKGRSSGVSGQNASGLSSSASARRKRKKKATFAKNKYEEEYEEDEMNDAEAGRTFRCFDNTVSLLMKSRLEETILRVAVGAIVLVALGIFILLSLPPTPPPQEIVELLEKRI